MAIRPKFSGWQSWATGKAKDRLRTLLVLFPVLVEMLLSPGLKSLRHFIYRLYPAAALAIAGRFYVRGEIAKAKEELAKGDIKGSVADKIAEIEQTLDRQDFPIPQVPDVFEWTKGAQKTKEIAVIHALHNALPLDQAGYAQRSQGLLKAQADHGIKVYAYTRPGYPHDLGRPKDADCKPVFKIDKVSYQQLDPACSLRRTGTDRDYIKHYALELIKAADRHQASIIHGHSNYLNGLAAIWAARWSGRRSVYEARGLWHITRASLEPAFRQSPLHAYEQVMELEAMRQADAVVALSSPLKDWMVEHSIDKDKIHVIGNAIDDENTKFLPRDPALAEQYELYGKTVIGYAGSLVAYEGLDLLLEAVEINLRDSLDIALLIVGDGKQKKQLERQANKLGVAEHVHFTGRVPPAEIPRYLGLFDICPLPRHDLPVCCLVPPLKPLEIMAAGKTLLVSALPPLLEFGIEDESRLSFEPGSSVALASQIRKLVLDKELRDRIGQQAQGWVGEHGSWQTNTEKYTELYEGLLS